MAAWTTPLEILGQRLDQGLLSDLYQAASVRVDELRRELDEAELPWVDPSTGRVPELQDLDRTAQVIIERAVFRGGALGGVTTLAGAAGVPSEVMGALLQSMRMCQRLAVVYGFDPGTDAGQLMVWRAMAAAWELPFPEAGKAPIRLQDLPDVIREQLPTPAQAATWTTQVARRQMVRSLRKRLVSWVPGLSTVLGVRDGRNRVLEQGRRAQAALRPASPAMQWDIEEEEEAVLLPG